MLAAGYKVTPLAGVWIEINSLSISSMQTEVTPLAGVWIEMLNEYHKTELEEVTPLAGVWIEIITKEVFVVLCSSHSPCGSVD